MPKIQRDNIPEPLMRHPVARARQREIQVSDLITFSHWLDSEPEVPVSQWFKRFPGIIVCGSGSMVRTFLKPGQVPEGREVN